MAPTSAPTAEWFVRTEVVSHALVCINIPTLFCHVGREPPPH